MEAGMPWHQGWVDRNLHAGASRREGSLHALASGREGSLCALASGLG